MKVAIPRMMIPVDRFVTATKIAGTTAYKAVRMISREWLMRYPLSVKIVAKTIMTAGFMNSEG